MYATCLFCNKPLGANETFESFPVGKRLAFDSEKGRLWVVCPHCERWNLSPLEERWEAIEDAERLYRDTRTRVATDNIGLAKLRDGTTIVRIGQPMRPGFAAWRYGDQFGRRRNRQLLFVGAGVAGLTALIVGGAVAAGSVGGFGYLISQAGRSIIHGRPNEVIAKIPTEHHGLADVRRRHLGETILGRAPNGELAIDLRFKDGSQLFVGRDAGRIAWFVPPAVNRFGGSKKAIASAVTEIERDGSPEAYLGRLTDVSRVWTRADRPGKYAGAWGSPVKRRRERWTNRQGLFGMPLEHRLAFEMALHEEVERRAMEGELAELEAAWRNAEEIAAISDSLLVPPQVEQALDRIKGQ